MTRVGHVLYIDKEILCLVCVTLWNDFLFEIYVMNMYKSI